MAKLSLVSSLLLTLTHPAFSATVTRSLDIVNDNVSPDGLTRPAVLVNGSLPGPLISGNASDTFLVNVTDSLTDTTMYRGVSIHWHGLFQKGHAADDGASWVTQCPIIPNNSFLYNFTAANQTGTYWYHSHEGTQYCDGLRGPLVIYDPEDPHANLYDVDDETTVITLADWYHSVSNSLFPNTGFEDPPPNSTLINGRGRYLNGPDVSLSVVNVTQGLRYRFRIVSVSCFPSFKFQIDGHNMTVIEADGIETEPVTVNALTIYAGQRYSVVVNASQPIGNYWIRAEPSASGAITGFEDGINSAILRYSGAGEEEPTSLQDTDDNPLNEADLVPLVNPGAPGEPRPGGVDLALNLDIGFNTTTGIHSVNGKAWENPETPVLLQILNGNTDLVPAGSLYELPGNSTIELSMPGSFPHPMHLHGHSFDIVRVAGSTEYNYENPPRRDVVSMGDSGGDGKNNVTIRFVTDNAGPWFLHCHIDWHLVSGLAVVFVEDRENINSATHFSDEWKNLCPAYSANPPDATFS